MKKITLQLIYRGPKPDEFKVELSEVPLKDDMIEDQKGDYYRVTRRLFNVYTGEIIIQAINTSL